MKTHSKQLFIFLLIGCFYFGLANNRVPHQQTPAAVCNEFRVINYLFAMNNRHYKPSIKGASEGVNR